MKNLAQSLILCVPLLYPLHTLADAKADKIRFVKKLYAHQAKIYNSYNAKMYNDYNNNSQKAPKYHDAVEPYADTELAKAYAKAHQYDKLVDKILMGETLDELCLQGVTQMYGGGQDWDTSVKRTYSVEKDGRVKVYFRPFKIPSAEHVTVRYRLKKYGNSYRVADMEIRSLDPDTKKVWHTPSYKASLYACIEQQKKNYNFK
ncbi:Uncharacterised protein [Neisseria zoodegmatis]|uniref:Uncharacterized protein n=1 Tax=Neisseria zoodegmatis TaxID=326523 RepID=A0A378X639_9NEIS|nr:hypothetical protein [Neisseria zoodegmatis]SUA48889.1 Uncharacterised protein [Neisseria zoodegmatis]